MKFIKLFESKYYDEFEKLKQITGVSTSFEDFIKKHQIQTESGEQLRKLLKTNILKESVENKDDFEEVKLLVKDWFDSYTDESFKVYTSRVEIGPLSTCPDCKETHDLVSLGYDYDWGKNLYECPNCDWRGTSEELDSELEFYLVNVTQFLEGKMNSISVKSEENFKWMLNYLNDKEINHLNSLIKPLGYSVFRLTAQPHIPRAWTTTILSLENIKMCYHFINDEFTQSDYQILIPEL